MTKTEKGLAICLTGSIILNVFLWWYSDPKSADCFVTSGYMIPAKIDKGLVTRYVDNYRVSMTSPDSTLGGIITRSAFDEMMCLKNCNAIAFVLAKDSSGTDGPGALGTFVIFQGVEVDYDEATRTIRSVNEIGSAYYLTHNWCPPSCMAY